MGALNGSMSYMRFLIEGDVPANPGSAFEKAIEGRKFTPLTPSAETPESAGWVATEDPFAEGRPLTRDLFLFGDLVVISYREDKWAIPRPLVKREVQKRIQKIIEDEKKDPDDIGKAFVKAVEAAIISELKQKSYPRSKVVDIVWDMGRGEARVFGRGTVVTERVASLFERTFQVRIDPGSWAAKAFELDLSSRAMGVLERLSPGWLFPDSLKTVVDYDDVNREKLSDDDDGDAPPWKG
jgi:hypothetical protein